jgi:hypothetical protein
MISSLMASNYLPIIYEDPIELNGKFLIAGEITNPLPIIDQRTITVSAFAGSANISPGKEKTFKISEKFLPCSSQQEMDDILYKGFIDTFEWLVNMSDVDPIL